MVWMKKNLYQNVFYKERFVCVHAWKRLLCCLFTVSLHSCLPTPSVSITPSLANNRHVLPLPVLSPYWSLISIPSSPLTSPLPVPIRMPVVTRSGGTVLVFNGPTEEVGLVFLRFTVVYESEWRLGSCSLLQGILVGIKIFLCLYDLCLRFYANSETRLYFLTLCILWAHVVRLHSGMKGKGGLLSPQAE